jgi:hypothetical protein
MFRRLLPIVAVATLAGPALAQTTPPNPTNPNGAFAPADLQIRFSKPLGNNEFAFVTSEIEQKRYFNQARCKCNDPIRISVDVLPASSARVRAAVTNGTYKIRVGNVDCVTANSANFMAAKCTDLASGMLADLVAKGTTVDTTVGDLFRAPNVTNGESCAVQFTQYVWLMVDQNPIDGLPDAAFADMAAPNLLTYLDGQAPPPPTDIKVSPGNEALSLTWMRGGLVDDQNGYVVFCSRADQQVFKPSFYTTDQFATAKTACVHNTTTTKSALTAVTQAAAIAPTVITAPDPFQQLDPNFVCSPLITTATEFRIKGLQNEIPYVVGVVAVDAAGNASAIETAVVQAPVTTIGFYDAYKAAGGQASGCSYGGRGASGVALLVLALALGWRRRR